MPAPNTDRLQREESSLGRRLFFIVLPIVIVVLVAAAIFYESQQSRNKSLPWPKSNHSLECGKGSTILIQIGSNTTHVDQLNLIDAAPIETFSGHEYLLMPTGTIYRYASRYCTAWCGYIAHVEGPEENEFVQNFIRKYLGKTPENYWIGLKGAAGGWFPDNVDAAATYFNFGDPNKTELYNADNYDQDLGCVAVDGAGKWSTLNCRYMLPFICERDAPDKIKRPTPFNPHQEKQCQGNGGTCLYASECGDGTVKHMMCPNQANNILCCIPNNPPASPPPLNSSVKTCAEAGGVCNHVNMDDCRDGRVLFDLDCPHHPPPREVGCCVKD